MNHTEVISRHPPLKDIENTDEMVRLAQAIAETFSSSGISISKRFSKILDISCQSLGMDAAIISMLRGPQMVPRYVNSKLTLNQVVPCGLDLTERLAANHEPLVLGQSGAKVSDSFKDRLGRTPARYVGVSIRFDGMVFGALELSSAEAASRDMSVLEKAMVQVLAAYAAGPLVLLGIDD